jgi:hypothetical protein
MYQLRILYEGRPVPIYHCYATKTDWVEAREGARYAVEVKNDFYNRVLAVVSVDGLNVINGKYEDSSSAPGYILHSHSNIKIPGWKISADDVREFYFTHKENSYSRKIGADERNIGVIAAAIYKEKITWTYTTTYWPPINYPPITTWPESIPWTVYNNVVPCNDVRTISSCMASPAGGTSEVLRSANFLSSSIAPEAATGSGEVKDFRTHKVSFGERELETTLVIYYDTLEGLRRRGIDVSATRNEFPKPFPNGDGYCPDK